MTGKFFDERNLQALCKHCHDLKTRRGDNPRGGGLALGLAVRMFYVITLRVSYGGRRFGPWHVLMLNILESVHFGLCAEMGAEAAKQRASRKFGPAS
jgi:hypothetical protein